MAELICGSRVSMKCDTATGECGLRIKMLNKTGSASVKGTLVAQSTATDNGFILEANEYDTIGIVDEAGVADGAEAWIWVQGRVQVLFKDGVAPVRGYVLLSADTDGRGTCIDVPSSNPVQAEHFKECGHVSESKSAGTNVLALCTLHFN